MRPKVAQHRNPTVGVAAIEAAYREIRSMIRLDIEFGIDAVVVASPTVACGRTHIAGTTTILPRGANAPEGNQEMQVLVR